MSAIRSLSLLAHEGLIPHPRSATTAGSPLLIVCGSQPQEPPRGKPRRRRFGGCWKDPHPTQSDQLPDAASEPLAFSAQEQVEHSMNPFFFRSTTAAHRSHLTSGRPERPPRAARPRHQGGQLGACPHRRGRRGRELNQSHRSGPIACTTVGLLG